MKFCVPALYAIPMQLRYVIENFNKNEPYM